MVFESHAARRRRRIKSGLRAGVGFFLVVGMIAGTWFLVLRLRPDWIPDRWKDQLTDLALLDFSGAGEDGASIPSADPLLKDIESLLVQLNFPSGPADGVIDPDTIRAIEDYQRMAGLPVTGAASQALRDELRSLTTPKP